VIFLDQVEKLKDVFEKTYHNDYFQEAIGEFDNENGIGQNILNGSSEKVFSIKESDKVSLIISVDLSGISDTKKRLVMAAFLAKSLDNIKSKNVSANIYSSYSVPRKIENMFNHIKPKHGQYRAMKECIGVDFGSKRSFLWRDAKLNGFVLRVGLTQDLHSFDSKQIARQKGQMLRDLSKNINYHLEQSLFRVKRTQYEVGDTELRSLSNISN
jgi:hypothetical protein